MDILKNSENINNIVLQQQLATVGTCQISCLRMWPTGDHKRHGWHIY